MSNLDNAHKAICQACDLLSGAAGDLDAAGAYDLRVALAKLIVERVELLRDKVAARADRVRAGGSARGRR